MPLPLNCTAHAGREGAAHEWGQRASRVTPRPLNGASAARGSWDMGLQESWAVSCLSAWWPRPYAACTALHRTSCVLPAQGFKCQKQGVAAQTPKHCCSLPLAPSADTTSPTSRARTCTERTCPSRSSRRTRPPPPPACSSPLFCCGQACPQCIAFAGRVHAPTYCTHTGAPGTQLLWDAQAVMDGQQQHDKSQSAEKGKLTKLTR